MDARQARPPPSDCAQLCGPSVVATRRPGGSAPRWPSPPPPRRSLGQRSRCDLPSPPCGGAAAHIRPSCPSCPSCRGLAGGGRRRPCVPVPPDGRRRRPTPGCPLRSVCPPPSAPLPARCPRAESRTPVPKVTLLLGPADRRTDGRTDRCASGRSCPGPVQRDDAARLPRPLGRGTLGSPHWVQSVTPRPTPVCLGCFSGWCCCFHTVSLGPERSPGTVIRGDTEHASAEAQRFQDY